jgi:hypothetical protein
MLPVQNQLKMVQNPFQNKPNQRICNLCRFNCFPTKEIPRVIFKQSVTAQH